MHQSKVKKTILTTLIFIFLFSINAVAIGDNSACANTQCHGDIVSKYSMTSHNLCTDCHSETSTYPHTQAPISEPGDCNSCHANEVSNFNSSKHGYMKCSSCHNVHGDSTMYKSLRKNLEIPLVSMYYSNTDFELCYMCHNEAKLMQMPDLNPNTILLYQSNFGIPAFPGPFATDFRKMANAWYDDDLSLSGYQSNLHYDHIGRFRAMSVAQWDPEGGLNRSYESCITCHNPHGSATSRLTVANLSFAWDFSAGDNVGGNISGFDAGYCNNCHSPGGAYVRNNLTTNTAISVGGPDCIGCHGLGAQKERINESVVAIGIHANITGSTNPVNPNSRCWACHNSDGSEPPNGTHPDRALNPYSCVHCHSSSAPSYVTPPQVVEHIPYGSDIKTNVSCVACHIKSIENYGILDSNTTNGNFYKIAHYGKKRTDLHVDNETDCAYCHQNTTSEFSDVFVKPSNTNITHNNNKSCYLCHRMESSTSGRIHDSDLAGGGGGACNACHGPGGSGPTVDEVDLGGHININSTGGVDTLTDDDCMGCHFDNAHPGPDATNTYYCADCHTAAGTSPRKSNITFTDKQHGAITCIDCHVADGTYHQNNPRGSVSNPAYVGRYAPGNTTVTNCADCHYAANLDDGPFNAPGGGEHIKAYGFGIGACASGGCHDSTPSTTTMVGSVHNLNYKTNGLKPSITSLQLNPTTVIQGTNVTVLATVLTSAIYSYVDGGQYRIMDGVTEVVTWTSMSASDGNFDTSSEDATATISTTALSVGTYTVEVKGMAGGPSPNATSRYYPMNGDVSVTETISLTVKSPLGYINGTVRSSGSPLVGAIVSTTGASATTAVDGTYSLSVAAGTYNVTASKAPEYGDSTITEVVVVSDTTTPLPDFELTLSSTGTITGTVTNSTI